MKHYTNKHSNRRCVSIHITARGLSKREIEKLRMTVRKMEAKRSREKQTRLLFWMTILD